MVAFTSKLPLRRLFHATGIACMSLWFFDCVACPLSIAGTSMIPTLHSGDVVWVSKVSELGLNDICIFSNPTNPGTNHIKRIAASSGTEVTNKLGMKITIPANHFWMLSDNPSPNVFDSSKYGVVSPSTVCVHLMAFIFN